MGYIYPNARGFRNFSSSPDVRYTSPVGSNRWKFEFTLYMCCAVGIYTHTHACPILLLYYYYYIYIYGCWRSGYYIEALSCFLLSLFDGWQRRPIGFPGKATYIKRIGASTHQQLETEWNEHVGRLSRWQQQRQQRERRERKLVQCCCCHTVVCVCCAATQRSFREFVIGLRASKAAGSGSAKIRQNGRV